MHRVIKAEYDKNYQIKLTFEDHSVRLFDMSPYIKDGISFIPLQDKDIFKMFSIQGNSIGWITGADVSPDFIYDNSVVLKQ